MGGAGEGIRVREADHRRTGLSWAKTGKSYLCEEFKSLELQLNMQ